MTSTEIVGVMALLPELNATGIGLGSHAERLAPEERFALLRERRSELLASSEQCLAACRWLVAAETTHFSNRPRSSRLLKYIMDYETGCYVSNGALIAAAVHRGFFWKPIARGPSAWLWKSQTFLGQTLRAGREWPS